MPSRDFSIRLSLFNAVMFFGVGMQLPFLPLWLQGRGLDGHQIAMVVAAMMAVRILAMPIGTYVADSMASRRQVIVACAVLSFACYLALHIAAGFPAIIVAGVLATAFYAPVVPLIEVFAIEGSTAHGLDYGRIRLWASISFLAGSLLGGALLEVIAISWLILLVAAAQGAVALATLALPPDMAAARQTAEPVRFGSIAALALTAGFAVFFLASGLAQSSHGMMYAFGSVHFDSLGYGKLTIGALWAIGIVIEIALFAFSNRVHAAFGTVRLIVAGSACGVVRWGLIALSPPLAILYLAQMLHAGTFALTHLGTMHYIQEKVPAGMRNTVQGLHAALTGGVLLAATMSASGWLYGLYGGHAFLVMALVSLLATGLAVLLLWISPRGLPAEDA